MTTFNFTLVYEFKLVLWAGKLSMTNCDQRIKINRLGIKYHTTQRFHAENVYLHYRTYKVIRMYIKLKEIKLTFCFEKWAVLSLAILGLAGGSPFVRKECERCFVQTDIKTNVLKFDWKGFPYKNCRTLKPISVTLQVK